jgi:hypothetical protein
MSFMIRAHSFTEPLERRRHLSADPAGLNADVTDLTATPPDGVYVLQMSYNESVFPPPGVSTADGHIYLVTLNEDGGGFHESTGVKTDVWVTAVDLLPPRTGTPFRDSMASPPATPSYGPPWSSPSPDPS